MTEHRLELQVAWQRHVTDGLDRFDGLLARHRERHRRYHTITHVAWVIRHVEELAGALDGTTDVVVDAGATRVDSGLDPDLRAGLDLDLAVAAAFYHDAVYEPRSPARANERASARLARRDLTEFGWATDRLERVGSMIEATASHAGPADLTEAVLFDADLAVLAADPAGYGDYARNVRAEYAHVDDESWRAGRAEVLRGFLDRDSIYATDAARDRWEERARANLTAELAELAGLG